MNTEFTEAIAELFQIIGELNLQCEKYSTLLKIAEFSIIDLSRTISELEKDNGRIVNPKVIIEETITTAHEKYKKEFLTGGNHNDLVKNVDIGKQRIDNQRLALEELFRKS